MESVSFLLEIGKKRCFDFEIDIIFADDIDNIV